MFTCCEAKAHPLNRLHFQVCAVNKYLEIELPSLDYSVAMIVTPSYPEQQTSTLFFFIPTPPSISC